MKIRKHFDILQSGTDCRKVALVDKDGNPVVIYPTPDGSNIFIINGTAYSETEANGMLFKEVDDDYIDVHNVPVSDDAKKFHATENYYTKHNVIACSNWFFGLAGIFGHYKFFTEKLWKKIPGFEKADEAEIIAVFMHWWFRDRYGYQNKPVGSTWSSKYPTVYTKDDESFNDYINKFQPVLKAFSDWCASQR